MSQNNYDLIQSLSKGQAEKERQAVANDLRLFKSALVTTEISPLYARYIGSTVTIAYQGNFRKFPVDGSQFKLTQGHYNALRKYLRHIDKQIQLAQNNAKFMGTDATGDFKKII